MWRAGSTTSYGGTSEIQGDNIAKALWLCGGLPDHKTAQ